MSKKILLFIIRTYQWFSRWTPPVCRFYPSCSSYAITAIENHGAIKGLLLTVSRLGKCHPFHPGGYDPVPCNEKIKVNS